MFYYNQYPLQEVMDMLTITEMLTDSTAGQMLWHCL